jgi:hypothetical protein
VNRLTTLRNLVPGAADTDLDLLAALPKAEAAALGRVLRQARRDALAADRDRRRRNREDRRRYRTTGTTTAVS